MHAKSAQRGRRSAAGRGGERGIALILTLLVLSILIVLVTQFAWSASVERTIARNAKDELKMLFAARGSLAYARAYLRADRAKGGKADSLREDWAGDTPDQPQRPMTIGDVNCQVRIEDAERFLNVNLFYNKATRPYAMEVVKRLCTRLQSATTDNGVTSYSTSSSTGSSSGSGSSDVATELAERIADYIDDDSEGQYEQGARNLPLTHADELLSMPNLSQDLYEMLAGVEGDPSRGIEPRQGVLDFLTASGNQKINVNTAPEQLLWAMIPDTNAQGQSIAEQRDDAVSKILSARTGTDVDASGNPTNGSTGSSASTGSSTSSNGTTDKPGKDFNTPAEWAQASGVQGLISATNATQTADQSGTVTVKGIPTVALGVTSQDFRITVDASRAGLSKSYEAIMRRGDTQFDVLIFREKQTSSTKQSQNQQQGQW